MSRERETKRNAKIANKAPEIVTSGPASEMLGVTARALSGLRQQGLIPSYQYLSYQISEPDGSINDVFNPQHLYKPDELQIFLDTQNEQLIKAQQHFKQKHE